MSVAKRQQFPCPPSRRTSSLNVENMVPGEIEFAVSCTVAKYIFYCSRRTYLVLVFSEIGSRSPRRRQSKHALHNSISPPDARVGTYYTLALPLQQILSSCKKTVAATMTMSACTRCLRGHREEKWSYVARVSTVGARGSKRADFCETSTRYICRDQ